MPRPGAPASRCRCGRTSESAATISGIALRRPQGRASRPAWPSRVPGEGASTSKIDLSWTTCLAEWQLSTQLDHAERF
jgi:hypothetical protein